MAINYWWVNHNATHRQERYGDYIWSPAVSSETRQKESYFNLTRVKRGDIIFSYAKKKVGAIGVVTHKYEEAERPLPNNFLNGKWMDHGWKVRVKWSVLENPISPKNHWEIIAPYMGIRNTPLNQAGIGKQSVYLASIPYDLGLTLQALAGMSSHIPFSATEDEDKEESKIQESDLSPTVKKQLIDARRGHGTYRARLSEIETMCRVTHMKEPSLLTASHIKPWRASSNFERLDGNNGLLLAPHIDRLFDRGLISFTDEGKLLFASGVAVAAMSTWGLSDITEVGSFNQKQIPYLLYHRNHIFAKAKAD